MRDFNFSQPLQSRCQSSHSFVRQLDIIELSIPASIHIIFLRKEALHRQSRQLKFVAKTGAIRRRQNKYCGCEWTRNAIKNAQTLRKTKVRGAVQPCMKYARRSPLCYECSNSSSAGSRAGRGGHGRQRPQPGVGTETGKTGLHRKWRP